MPPAVIEVEGLGKRYALGEASAGGSLKEALTALVRREGRRSGRDELWALKGVSFEVGEGQLVGIVGANGAGKSTLLKILARITDPTAGWARTRGRVSALLEVGTAFHPELTGRENVEINGALLGMRRAEVRAKFDDIVEFAGVERFLDTPVKRYSSGMYLRLAFSVAAHMDPEIVVVDEVLAVGDAEFQRRCLARMAELGKDGRTVLFVSHDIGSVGQLCERVLWIDGGSVRDDGPTEEVLHRYLRSTVVKSHRLELAQADTGPAGMVDIAVGRTDAAGAPLRRGDALAIVATIDVRAVQPGLDVAFWVLNATGTRIVDERLSDEGGGVRERFERPGRYEIRLALPPLLPPGDYALGAWLGTEATDFFYGEILEFDVLPLPTDRQELRERPRVVSPGVGWSVRGGG
jgi:ABC-2 type transport system ATP-binding protein/lipopolysaccharide transport system ATP-binding protein